MVLKIAMVQQKAVPNDKEQNLARALHFISQACEMGADLVLFPEMWSNGYAPPFRSAFEHPLHPSFEKERGQWLQNAVATFLSKATAKPQNTAILIDRSGAVILNYAKVHTCDFSLEKLLQCGNEFKVCTFDGVQIGVMICYDREFPESARVLMLKGAELILVPNACDMNPIRLNQLRARAFENMVGIAMANYPQVKWGASCAFSPIVFDKNGNCLDNTLVQASACAEELVIAEFDLDKIRAYRGLETWGNAYRKPQAYTELLSCEVRRPFVRTK